MSNPSKRLHVLIADADPDIRAVLLDRLQSRHYLIDVTQHGEECLRLLQHRDYDLVFLNTVLPRLSGVDILKRLPATKGHVPVVIVTGHPRHGQEALNAGAKAMLLLPSGFSEVLILVDSLTSP